MHENRIYSVNIHCGDSYPDAPPTVQFVSKVNLPCVDPRNGKVRRRRVRAIHASNDGSLLQVDASKLPCMAQWKRENTMETILIELRRYVTPLASRSRTELRPFARLGTWLSPSTRSCHSPPRARRTASDPSREGPHRRGPGVLLMTASANLVSGVQKIELDNMPVDPGIHSLTHPPATWRSAVERYLADAVRQTERHVTR